MEQEQHGTFPNAPIGHVMAVNDDSLHQQLVSHSPLRHGTFCKIFAAERRDLCP
jgi:hypothetical protein